MVIELVCWRSTHDIHILGAEWVFCSSFLFFSLTSTVGMRLRSKVSLMTDESVFLNCAVINTIAVHVPFFFFFLC